MNCFSSVNKFKLSKLIKQKILPKLRNFILFKLGILPGIRKNRPQPLNPDGKVLVHFGCGIFNDSRYINVDARPGWHIHYVDTIENCNQLFPPGSADLIYCCHTIEHVSHQKISDVVKGVYVTLKRGGVFRISVPDFDMIVKMYQEKGRIEDIMEPLMGGQGYPENFHSSVFSETYLKKLLMESGFREVRKWDPLKASYHTFDDWAGRTFPLYGKDWQISLNLEAVK